ncbi:G2/mitotic-specific cyclin-B-like isoform X2 [Tachypleus tridentatus]|uniref:G2/mitotic-specific cyclin-B-like isoform X2 n=1 Tax=Tachypleus tridentatus TaxID=6853 RepID=UPI003FD3B66D
MLLQMSSNVSNNENAGVHLPVKKNNKTKLHRIALEDIKNKAELNKVTGKTGLEKGKKVEAPFVQNGFSRNGELSKYLLKSEIVCSKLDQMVPMDVSAADLAEAFSSQLLPPSVENIDAEDDGNPQLVTEYVNDIYKYMRTLEIKYSIRENHLDKQTEITGKMRSILIDWLVQVHLRFHLLQETLYLTVAILDRCLQEKHVQRSRLQLVGVAAMFIAAKYEEMFAPEVGDFVYITDNAYSKKDILRMEMIMLDTLAFNLGRPLPLHFLRRYSKAGNADSMMHTLAKYLMELSLPEYNMVHIAPSKLAAAALCLAMKLLDEAPWTNTLVYYSFYEEAQLLPVMKQFCILILKSEKAKLQAVRMKYASSKFMKISMIPELKSQYIVELSKESE